MMTASRMAIVLRQYPYPDAVVTLDGLGCNIRVNGVHLLYDMTWQTADGQTVPAEWPTFDSLDDGDRAHAEIRRVLAIVSTPAAEPTKIARMSPGHLGGDLLAHPFPGAIDLRLTTDGLHFTVGDITLRYDGEAFHAPRHRVESTLPHPAAINAQGVHAEIHRVLAIVMGASDRAADLERRLAAVKSDRHEETLRWADEREALRAEVKRLLRQRAAAHAVLDEAAIGLEVEGSPRWTLARRCRAAVEPVWGYLDALQAFDMVGEIVGVTGKTGERGFIDAVIARVKALRNDDDTRAAIAVAVGLDDSASLGLILDTVKSADTTKDADLARLVSYHQAPIKFSDRPLTLAERASFVIRRLWQGRTNAANEATSLRRELGDIEAALSDLPDTAEREPIGDREEHLGLSAAERIRLSR